MPQLTGIDLLKNMPNPPKVIITTAYRDYAVDAFDLEVLDYLLKPFSLPRFSKAINRFYQQMNDTNTIQDKRVESTFNDCLFVKADKKLIKVSIADIVYIESLGDYVVVHTTSEKITTKERISNLFDKLPTDQFIRIHRGYVVAIRSIRSILAGSIEVGCQKLPIGRNYKDAVDQFLQKNQIKE